MPSNWKGQPGTYNGSDAIVTKVHDDGALDLQKLNASGTAENMPWYERVPARDFEPSVTANPPAMNETTAGTYAVTAEVDDEVAPSTEEAHVGTQNVESPQDAYDTAIRSGLSDTEARGDYENAEAAMGYDDRFEDHPNPPSVTTEPPQTTESESPKAAPDEDQGVDDVAVSEI